MSSTTVRSNLIRDTGMQFTDTGRVIRSTYMVEGLSGTRVYEDAINAPGIPRMYQGHPTYDYCLAKGFDVQPATDSNGRPSTTKMQVTVTYEAKFGGGGIPFPTINFTSSVRQVETDQNTKGETITVRWSGRKDDKGNHIHQRAVVPKDVHDDVIIYERWIVLGTNTFLDYPTPIEVLRKRYLNKVNGQEFRGGAKYEWKCTQCDGTTPDYGKSYQITIRLERRADPDSWAPWAWFTKANGEVPQGITKEDANDGVRQVEDVYDTADFSQIGVDLQPCLRRRACSNEQH